MRDVLHERQTKSASLRVMDQRIARAIKLFEDSRLLVPLDANAAIAHLEFQQRVVAVKPDTQKFFIGRIFQCIVDEIDKRTRNRFAINRDRRDPRIDLLFKSKSLLLDLVAISVERVAHQLSNVSLSKVILFAPRLDAREVENVAD